jgi:hypothetical protein
MMSEDYVSFETAKLLKEKGFDEYGMYFYTLKDEGREGYKSNKRLGEFAHNSHPELKERAVSCPTLQMAMKWLREEKNWYIQVSIQNDGTYIGYIYRTDGFPYVGWDKRRVKETPEEAAEATIKYCLENLV